MLKKTIKYTDFDGNEASEDFFFHLSKAELVELEMSHEGGLSASLQRIVDAEDGKGIIKEFKNIILTAYGKRSEDGKRFIKNDIIRQEFESTEAYSALFMELVTDTDAAIEFVNGVIPAGMAEEAMKIANVDLKVVEKEDPEVKVLPSVQVTVVTRGDLEKMSGEELAEIFPRIKAGQVVLSEFEHPMPDPSILEKP